MLSAKLLKFLISHQKLKVLTDIRAEVLVGELNLLSLCEALLQSLLLVLAIAAYADYSTAVGYHLTVFHGCTGMEYYRAFYLVDALDRVSLLVCLRIAATHEHHADCCTLVKLDGSLVEVACSYSLKEVHDVALQS